MLKLSQRLVRLSQQLPRAGTRSQFLMQSQTSLSYLSSYRFSTNEKPGQKEEIDEEAEYLKRKKQLEQQELAELKKSMGKSGKVSLAKDLFKLLRRKVILGLIFGWTIFLAYKFYTFTETIQDPITGKKKIVFMKYSYEKKLAKVICTMMGNDFTVLPTTNSTYTKITEQYNKVAESPDLKALNLPFNGDIKIINTEDLTFFVLSNGSLFLSTGILPFIKDEKSFLMLYMMELVHIYLRTNAQNINFSDLYKVIQLQSANFSTTKLQNPELFHKIRLMNFLPFFQEQEDKMMQLLPTFMETVGMKVDVEKDFVPLLQSLSSYNRKFYIGKDVTERKHSNFFRKHPFLERGSA